MKKLFATLVCLLAWHSLASAQAANVTLSWTAPGDDGNTGTATSYDIRWATSAITAANWATANQVAGEPAPKIAGSSESFSFPVTMTSGTTYYFAVKAKDEVGNESGLSNVVSIVADLIPPGTIINVSVTVQFP